MKLLSATLQRRRGFALVIAIAALAILWYIRRSKPEHLKPGNPYMFAVSPLESRYELSENPRTHSLNLAYRRASGDKFQKMVSVSLPPGLHFDQMSTRLLRVNGDRAYFTLIEEAALRRLPPGYGLATAGGTGTILRAKPIIRHYVIQPSKEMMHICCFAVKGGAIQTLLSGKGITNIAITDDTIYWIDPRPEPVTMVESRDGVTQTFTPSSLLMATPIKTLQTHRIADKISMSTQFVPDQTSLYGFHYDSGPDNQPSTHVWYYAPDLPGPVALTDNFTRGDGNRSGDKPVALGDRLYWIEDHIEMMPPPKGVTTGMMAATRRVIETSVVSVRRDGTQRRVVLTLPVIANSPSIEAFAADRGRLYLGLTETVIKRSDAQVTTTLCRLDPDSPQPLIKLLRLPNTARVEWIYEGYVYYVVTEEHNGFFGDERNESVEHYRWKLPE